MQLIDQCKGHLRAEVLRFQTLPANWVLAGVVVVASVLVAYLLTASALVTDASTHREGWAVLVTQGATAGAPPLFGYLIGLTGVLGWAEEVNGDVSMVTALSFPRRARAFLARNAAIITVAAALATCTWLVGVCCGALFSDLGSPVGLAHLLLVKWARMAFFATCLALIAGALTMIARSAVVATFMLLLIPWVIEPLIVQIVILVPGLSGLTGALRYLPFSALGDALAVPTPSGFAFGREHLPLAGAAAVTVVVTATALSAAGAVYSRSSLPRHTS